MFFNEFSTDDMKDVIEGLAQECADDDQWCEGTELWTRVYEKCGYWCCYPADAVKLIAYYGALDAVKGYESYEDTPMARFEGDVYDRAVEIRGSEEV